MGCGASASAAAVVQVCSRDELSADRQRRLEALGTAEEGDPPTPAVSPEEPTVEDLVRSGAVRFVKLSWLVELRRSSRHARISRRQELPPDAFADTDATLASLKDETEARRIVVISYSWLSKSHPDPEGVHLSIVEKVAQGIAQHAWPDWKVFWDFASLFQWPRSAEEDALFDRALSSMHLVYSIRGARGYRLTEVPATAANPTPYASRGWTNFESAVLCSGMMMEVRDFDAKSDRLGNLVCRPPMLPDKFAAIIRTKKFTSPKADMERVIQLYYKIWPTITQTEKIKNAYTSLGDWDDDGMEDFLQALPHMQRLRLFILHDKERRISEALISRLATAFAERGIVREDHYGPKHTLVLDKGHDGDRRLVISR